MTFPRTGAGTRFALKCIVAAVNNPEFTALLRLNLTALRWEQQSAGFVLTFVMQEYGHVDAMTRHLRDCFKPLAALYAAEADAAVVNIKSETAEAK